MAASIGDFVSDEALDRVVTRDSLRRRRRALADPGILPDRAYRQLAAAMTD